MTLFLSISISAVLHVPTDGATMSRRAVIGAVPAARSRPLAASAGEAGVRMLNFDDDTQLDMIEASLSPSSYAAGYFEFEQNGDFFKSSTSVWQPEPKLAAAELLGQYEAPGFYPLKLINLLTGGPFSLLQRLWKKPHSQPAGSAVVAADAAVTPSVKPVGAVLLVHGLGGNPLQMTHLAEALAVRGYIVVAPTFDDSEFSPEKPNPVLYGVRHTITRCWHAEGCIDWLHARYGTSLPICLVGHSVGADTVARMRGEYPKVFLAGPVGDPVGKVALRGLAKVLEPSAQPPSASTEPPCLILGSLGDVVTLSPPETARLVGRPGAMQPTLEQVTSGRLPNAAQYAFRALDGMECHCSPFFAQEARGHLAKKGLPDDARAARLVVPLVVKFCGQWLARSAP